MFNKIKEFFKNLFDQEPIAPVQSVTVEPVSSFRDQPVQVKPVQAAKTAPVKQPVAKKVTPAKTKPVGQAKKNKPKSKTKAK